MRERFSTTDTESFSRIRAKGAPRRGRWSERFDDHEPEVVFGFDDHGAYAADGDEYADFHGDHDGDHESHDGEHENHDDSYDSHDSYDDNPDGGPAGGDRWSTWDQSTPTEKGPEPRPAWVVTELAAVDTELGLVKTGKEADVFLLERAVPGTDRRTLMAAKRYRDSQHRMFHRDSGYLEGRRHKESRIARAMAKRTAFGKEAIAAQWAGAEFAALCRLWSAGVAVPYPVQILGTEILMEFVGDESGTAAPRLAQLRAEEVDVEDLWEQLGRSLSLLAGDGYAHGDLSAYNILVHEGRLVIIDVPQIVDVVANPRGRAFLERDVRNVGAWFVSRGLPEHRVGELVGALEFDARLG
ncbi:RIO-like kinase [Kitasatospora purpeofusca]|uniref:serine protein kinase RIO n=1 Tax=Kitasatospora purpeofusca TaxID=67352 RepID=UPI002252997F|nr:RIO1 family regulatory kinase/ATPase [Kitasatospora purpeofusca]MCX4690445.1 RIO-like kinase [Kitasatospora purpeofusca]